MTKKYFYLVALVALTAVAASTWWRANHLQPTVVQQIPSAARSAKPQSSDVKHYKETAYKDSISSAVPPAHYEAVVFGSLGPVELDHIPAGRFHDQLAKISPTARGRALKQLGDTHVPLIDVNSLSVDRAGFLFYACDFALPTAGADSIFDQDHTQSSRHAESVAQAPVPISNPPIRHSKPGAPNVIYLDFNGHNIVGTAWNTGNETLVAKPYDKDGDPTTFNDSEQADIILIWERVAEDYKPFNVDVTAQDPVTFGPNTGRVLITSSVDANGLPMPAQSAGGVAYVGVFGSVSYPTYFSPALVYADHLGPNGQSYIAEAASHEMGHNMGLSHDGTTSGSAYYGGHGSGETSWGPIMGTGYNRNVSQWSKGEYYLANNMEDDLAIIAGKLGYQADDRGDTNGTATPMTVSGASMSASGFIGQTGEGDRFSFTTGAGAISITGSPYRASAGTYGGNLDIKLELIDATNAVLVTSNPAATTGATLSAILGAGTYYVRVSGTGVGSPLSSTPDGYTSYASLGSYTLSGTAALQTAPVFTTQPTPKLVNVGATATFAVATTGSPTPTWQWQRLPSASGVWSNLSNVGSYSGVTTLTLTVSATSQGMSGDQFRCVATNTSGSITSNAATLTERASSVATNDFNGDGKSDIIWENTATGDRALWLMNGTTYVSSVDFGIVPPAWRIAATADFNADGKPDIVLENTSTGERTVWLMNGTVISSNVSLGIVATVWRITAAADFNGDGKPDIVVENTSTGERAIWLMNGTVVSSTLSMGVVPVAWRIVATGDFNGDGKPDLVWENRTTGEHALWLMNGTVFSSSISFGVTPTVWRLVTVGDFNGDGNPDMFWENTATGEHALWLMNGTIFSSGISFGMLPLTWHIAK